MATILPESGTDYRSAVDYLGDNPWSADAPRVAIGEHRQDPISRRHGWPIVVAHGSPRGEVYTWIYGWPGEISLAEAEAAVTAAAKQLAEEA